MTNSARLITIVILSAASQVNAQSMFLTAPTPRSEALSSSRLTETDALVSELETARRNLSDLAARLDRIYATTKSTRTKAELVSYMIKEIKTVEDQINRIKRELKTFAKIPYFKMLKPIVLGLERLNDKVEVIRKEADRVRRDVIDPSVKKMKSFENEVKDASRAVEHAESDTRLSLSRLVFLKKTVVARGSRFGEVQTLESASRITRYPVREILPVLKTINSSTANVETKLNAYARSLTSVTTLRPGIRQLKSKLTPIDKKARDIAKVLSRKLKLPGGKSITIRKVLEAPGNLFDFILKPLQKIAQAALKPITGKLKFDLKPPKQFVQIQERLHDLKKPADLTTLQRQLQQLRRVQLQKFSRAMQKLKTTSIAHSDANTSSTKQMHSIVVWSN